MVHDEILFITDLLSGTFCPRTSCQDRCGNKSTDDHSLCSCDKLCQTLGDCCVDFSTECFGLAKMHSTKPYDSHNWNLAIIESRNATASKSETHLLVIFNGVDYCPKSSPLHEKCENIATTGDLRQYITVCHPKNQEIFPNQYCAYCNGYRINELVSFELHVDIPSACKELDMHTTGSNKPRMSLERVIEECSTWSSLFVPKPCHVAVYRNKGYLETDESMCQSHVNPVVVTNTSNTYRNKHCLPPDLTNFECFDGVWPSAVPTNVPREVNAIISLDSSGVPFLHSQVTSASKTPKKYVFFNLLSAIFATILLPGPWALCGFERHACSFLLDIVALFTHALASPGGGQTESPKKYRHQWVIISHPIV